MDALRFPGGPPIPGAPWVLASQPPATSPRSSQAHPSTKKPRLNRVGPGGIGVKVKAFFRGHPCTTVVEVTDDRRLERFSEQLSSMVNSLLDTNQLLLTGPKSYKMLTSSLVYSRPPTSLDDASVPGVVQGCPWIDTSQTPPDVYLCRDASSGAASWIKVSDATVSGSGYTGNT